MVQTTATDDNLSSGTYCVTVTDIPSGCVKDTCFTLNDNVPGATIVITEPVSTTCVGSNDASVIYDITYDPGFVQPPTVVIVDMDGNEVVNGSLAPGFYCINITDGNGCMAASMCFDVVEPSQIDMDIAIDNSCPSPGITIVEVIGGNGGYVFDWADLPGTDDPQNRPNLANGTYSVTVTDINGCTAFADDLLINANCCEPPVIQSVVIIEATCGNNDGSVCFEMVGNNADYNFALSPNIGTPNSIGNCITELPAGSYSMTITTIGDPTCPEVTETFTIGNSDGPMATVVNSTPASCNAADGSVEMSNQDYNYEWCNGEMGYNPMMLPAGECQVTITDPITGCIDYRTVIIEEDNPLVLEVIENNLPDCGIANGSVTINVSGLGPNYSYAWSNGNTSSTDSNLSSGTYCVTVTDTDSGCMKDTCFTLSDNVPGAVVVIQEPVSTTCIGSNDGTVDYMINYDPNFAMPDSVVIHDMNGDTVTNGSLSPGLYCILVYDANGCLAGSNCFTVVEPASD